MGSFSVGEEVLFDGKVFVVAAKQDRAPYRYHLLASGPGGTRFVWADEAMLHKIDSYLRPLDDTERY